MATSSKSSKGAGVKDRVTSVETVLTHGFNTKPREILRTKPIWSPNNLRRLVIGAEGLIECYHCVPSQSGYTRHYKPTLLHLGTPEAVDWQLEAAGSKPMSILRALTKTLVFSSIEEIVFCTQGYDSNLLNLDLGNDSLVHALLGRGEVSDLRSRFVRLRGILLVDSHIADFSVKVLSRVNVRELDTVSVRERCEQCGVPVSVVLDYYNAEPLWWKSTYKREGHYYFDREGGTLANHFDAIKRHFEVEEKAARVNELNNARELKTAERLELFKQEKMQSFELVQKALRGYNRVVSANLVGLEGAAWFNSVKDAGGSYIVKAYKLCGLGDSVVDVNFKALNKYFEDWDIYNEVVAAGMQVYTKEVVKDVGDLSNESLNRWISAYLKAIHSLYTMLLLDMLMCLDAGKDGVKVRVQYFRSLTGVFIEPVVPSSALFSGIRGTEDAYRSARVWCCDVGAFTLNNGKVGMRDIAYLVDAALSIFDIMLVERR